MPEEIPPHSNGDDFDEQVTIAGLRGGVTVLQRFKLVRCVGRGGMGEVWLARDQTLGDDVALKLLPRLIQHDEVAIDDLKNETRRGRQLSHPNVVRVFDFYRDNDNAAVAMELVDGENLSRLRLKQKHGVFRADEIASWVGQLLSGLDYAHRACQVVHRDLKPSNLLVDSRSSVLKIADFGIARCLVDSLQRVTLSAQSRGTLCYMSPEQAIGRGTHFLDDIYAVGATLYELLAGSPPFFTGDISAQIQKVPPPPIIERQREQGFSSPPPQNWEMTILRCLAKERAQRPQSAAEISHLLGLAGPATAALPYEISPATSYVPRPAPSVPDPAALQNQIGQGEGVTVSTSAAVFSAPAATQKTRFDLTRGSVTAGGLARTEPGAPMARPVTRGMPKWVIPAIAVVMILGIASVGAVFWYLYKSAAFASRPDNVTPGNLTKKTDIPPVPIVPPGQVWHVPGEFPTVQAALNSAVAGQQIVLEGRRYHEQLVLKAGVTLVGENPNETIISSDGRAGSTLLCTGATGMVFQNIGFEHEGDDAFAAGQPVVKLDDCEAKFAGCEFRKGLLSGLAVSGASKVTLSKCEFHDNADAGLQLTSGAVIEATDCGFANNQKGVYAELAGTTAKLTHCVFEKHLWHGVEVGEQAVVTILRSNLTGNQQAGCYVYGTGAAALLDDCDFFQNGVGAKASRSGKLSVFNSRLNSNGVGVMAEDADQVELRGNRIASSASHGIVLVAPEGAHGTAQLNKNTVLGSAAMGLWVEGGVALDAVENDFGPNGMADIYLRGGARGRYSKNTLRSKEDRLVVEAGGKPDWLEDNIEAPAEATKEK